MQSHDHNWSLSLISGEYIFFFLTSSAVLHYFFVLFTVLLQPMEGQGNLIADPDADYQLFDRVINVREGFTVPLGLRGVVIGIHTGEEKIWVSLMALPRSLNHFTCSGCTGEERGVAGNIIVLQHVFMFSEYAYRSFVSP